MVARLGSVPWARLTVIADNQPNPLDPGLRSTWGLSVAVEIPGRLILFDADTDPSIIESNSRILGVDLSRVDFVVVSHEHRDHTGGLPAVARARGDAPVYVPSRMTGEGFERVRSAGFKRVIPVRDTTVVAEGVAIIGELPGQPYEQALAVNVEGLGLVVLVGCSHPGVSSIAAKAAADLGERVHAVIGGYHLAYSPPEAVEREVEALLRLGVEKLYPMHCSGDRIREILRTRHPERYGEAYTGSRLTLAPKR